jgi:hypothetical protein
MSSHPHHVFLRRSLRASAAVKPQCTHTSSAWGVHPLHETQKRIGIGSNIGLLHQH